jgi:hypothetical protein
VVQLNKLLYKSFPILIQISKSRQHHRAQYQQRLTMLLIKGPPASFHGRSRYCQSGLPTFRGIVTTPRAGGEQLFDADARAPRPQ